MSEMTPSRGYLVKGLFDWIVDNDLTPHLVVAADVPGTNVPQAFVKEGQITLNVSPSAVRDLFIDTQAVSFSARFGGVPMQVYVPTAAILAIFARENGQGMGFGMEPGAEQLQQSIEQALASSASASVESDEKKSASTKKAHPGLRVVK